MRTDRLLALRSTNHGVGAGCFKGGRHEVDLQGDDRGSYRKSCLIPIEK
jgi:hypothetical protein